MSLLHPPRRPGRAICLVLLFLAAIVVRMIRATQETIANPDIMRYIDQARGLAAAPVETLRNEVYHPLHALAALGVHTLIQPFFDSDRLTWLWSMRAVGIVAAAVVTVEVVLLARLLGAPFWSAMLAGTAWLVGRRTSVYGSDGLSDMLAISLFGGAMILGFHALRGVPRVGWGRKASAEVFPRGGRRWLLWFWAGLLAGLSYLTRPEGLVAAFILTAAVVFLAFGKRMHNGEGRWKIFPRFRLATRPAAMAGLLMMAGACIPAVPYMAVTERLTGKVGPQPILPLPAPAAFATPPVMVLPYIARELFETFFWPCALVFGVALLFRPRPWGRPRLRVPVILWMIAWTGVMAILLVLPSKGYLDGRHTLPLTFLLFAMLGLALAAWERPMRMWMGWWRSQPERWQRLASWQRWAGWPRAWVMIVAGLMMVPGVVEMFRENPRADRSNLVEAARWIEQNTVPEVVVADHERLVGFYSNRRYGQWFGSPELPELHQLEELRARAGGGSAANVPLIAGRMYELGAGVMPALSIGPYRAIASFRSGARNDASHDHLYVLYARGDDPVLLGQKAAVPLASLPAGKIP